MSEVEAIEGELESRTINEGRFSGGKRGRIPSGGIEMGEVGRRFRRSSEMVEEGGVELGPRVAETGLAYGSVVERGGVISDREGWG
jgi:hypothetical protein